MARSLVPGEEARWTKQNKGHCRNNVPPLSLAAYWCKDRKGQGKQLWKKPRSTLIPFCLGGKSFQVHFIVEAVWVHRLGVLWRLGFLAGARAGHSGSGSSLRSTWNIKVSNDMLIKQLPQYTTGKGRPGDTGDPLWQCG